MSTAVLVLATALALINVLAPAGLLAWGLSGGDGEPDSLLHAALALLLLVAAVVAVAMSLRSFDGLGRPGWAAMWVAPALAFGAVLLPGRHEGTLRQRVRGLWVVPVLALPPVLTWIAGGVR